MPFGIIKQYLYPIVGIALLLVLGFATYKVYSFGYDRAEIKYIKQISEINSLSADLLKKQKDEHDEFVERQDRLVNGLRSKNTELENTVRENEKEAAKEPDGNEPGIGKSRVLRLNRVR